MKYLLFFSIILLAGCATTKQKNFRYKSDFSLKDELNKSIVDGFYNSDTTKISKNTYFLR